MLASVRDMDSAAFVYILESVSQPERHYTGMTHDVGQRLALHNQGAVHHTSAHRPWRLLVSIQFTTRSSAARFEKYLKSGSGRAFSKRHFE
jgi:putative endonuclease